MKRSLFEVYTEFIRRTKEEILSGDAHEPIGHARLIFCPYCGNCITNENRLGNLPELCEEGNHNMECDSCGREYILTTEVSYYYGTSRKE